MRQPKEIKSVWFRLIKIAEEFYRSSKAKRENNVAFESLSVCITPTLIDLLSY